MSDTSTRSQDWDELKKKDMQARKVYKEFSETLLGRLRMDGYNTSIFCPAPTLAEVMWWKDMCRLNMQAQEMGLAPASAIFN